jgi:hypothetical protein
MIYRGFWFIGLLVAILGCNLSASNQAPPPTPDLPQVRFVTPDNNARVLEGVDLPIDIFAEDTSVGIARIELRLDGETFRDAAPPNFNVERQFRVEMNWIAEGVGLHTLSAIAYRPDGTRSDETFITIEVVSE